jgi:hypothetical protein
MQEEAERINRAFDIMELWLAGYSWNEIAHKMGITYQQAQRDMRNAHSELVPLFADRALDEPRWVEDWNAHAERKRRRMNKHRGQRKRSAKD